MTKACSFTKQAILMLKKMISQTKFNLIVDIAVHGAILSEFLHAMSIPWVNELCKKKKTFYLKSIWIQKFYNNVT